ncbi:MAG: hypothetical protein V7K76_24425 [Nostoc sp.]|uniref:hypothetical protein n=1 Tax=Nostoc sp. TaxID=1180 RepID=UPI002FF95077
MITQYLRLTFPTPQLDKSEKLFMILAASSTGFGVGTVSDRGVLASCKMRSHSIVTND